MTKNIAQIIFISILLVASNAFDDEFEFDTHERQINENDFDQYGQASFEIPLNPQGNMDQQQEQQQQQQQQMLQQAYYACVVLSRHQLSQSNTDLLNIIKAQTEKQQQMDIWKKIYIQHVKHCLQQMNYQILNQVSQAFESQKFDFSEFNYLFNMMDFDEYKTPGYQVEFTQEDKHIGDFIDQFEKRVQEQNQDKAQEDEEMDQETFNRRRQKQQQQEVSLFGINFHELDTFQQLIILTVVMALLVGIIIKGISVITKEISGPQGKKIKQKKNKKQ